MSLDETITFPQVESVGPEVSGELVQAAITAVLAAIGAVLFYIWLRFEWQFSVGAIAALVHDIVITIGIFSLLQIKFDLAIIAALLTGLFGIFANVALIINIALIFAILSIISGTLTLPGIAGIVLTVGMAVDANVLVFERIREELKKAKNPRKAIELGYERAFSAIIDANITTLIAAVILLVFGSGPVKGFAITLGIGIVTSVFTAIWVTRLLISIWIERKRPKSIEI